MSWTSAAHLGKGLSNGSRSPATGSGGPFRQCMLKSFCRTLPPLHPCTWPVLVHMIPASIRVILLYCMYVPLLLLRTSKAMNLSQNGAAICADKEISD